MCNFIKDEEIFREMSKIKSCSQINQILETHILNQNSAILSLQERDWGHCPWHHQSDCQPLSWEGGVQRLQSSNQVLPGLVLWRQSLVDGELFYIFLCWTLLWHLIRQRFSQINFLINFANCSLLQISFELRQENDHLYLEGMNKRRMRGI